MTEDCKHCAKRLSGITSGFACEQSRHYNPYGGNSYYEVCGNFEPDEARREYLHQWAVKTRLKAITKRERKKKVRLAHEVR